MIDTSQLKKGIKIELDGEVYEVLEYFPFKIAMRQAMVKVKLRNIFTGNVITRTFTSGEKFEIPDLEEKVAQYLYQDGENFVFMDMETYEQYAVPEEVVGEKKNFLKEGLEVRAMFYKGKLASIELPITVEFEVVDTPPGIRGDTVSGGTKPAKISTGAVVQVPLFINVGDIIKIDTRTGEYVERVK